MSATNKIKHLHAQYHSVDDIYKILAEDGAVIVEDIVTSETLVTLNTEIDEISKKVNEDHQACMSPIHKLFFGEHTFHLAGMAGKSTCFAHDILLNPMILALCDKTLLPNCANYRLNIAHLMDRGPGSEQQMLHRDDEIYSYLPRPFPGQLMLASIIALCDFTAENGATRIIPGSHRWERDCEMNEENAVAAEMPAGSAVFYLGNTIHGGGPNTTQSTQRRGMHLSFNLGWLRTEENNYLSTPLEVARRLPRKAQELLGYTVHDAIETGGGYLGAVDTRNPMDLIDNGLL